jgi:integrase/recombinase XerC
MAPNQTVHHAISQYLATLAPRFAPQTILAYGQALRLFAACLHDQLSLDPKKTPITAITLDCASTYLNYLQDTHSIETEHLYSRAMLGFYQYVDNHTTSNSQSEPLAEYLTANRRAKHLNTLTLPLEAIETILTHVTTTTAPQPTDQANIRDTLRLLRDKAFLLTLANTGLRVSEICNLRIANIDLARQVMILSTDFLLPIPPVVLAAISSYLAARNPVDALQHLFHASHLPLFARHDKKVGNKILPISRWTAANIVELWAITALPPDTYNELTARNCPISPQTFRHYFVITTLQQTQSLQATQTLARHADATTTRRYLQYTSPDTKAGPNH